MPSDSLLPFDLGVLHRKGMEEFGDKLLIKQTLQEDAKNHLQEYIVNNVGSTDSSFKLKILQAAARWQIQYKKGLVADNTLENPVAESQLSLLLNKSNAAVIKQIASDLPSTWLPQSELNKNTAIQQLAAIATEISSDQRVIPYKVNNLLTSFELDVVARQRFLHHVRKNYSENPKAPGAYAGWKFTHSAGQEPKIGLLGLVSGGVENYLASPIQNKGKPLALSALSPLSPIPAVPHKSTVKNSIYGGIKRKDREDIKAGGQERVNQISNLWEPQQAPQPEKFLPIPVGPDPQPNLHVPTAYSASSNRQKYIENIQKNYEKNPRSPSAYAGWKIAYAADSAPLIKGLGVMRGGVDKYLSSTQKKSVPPTSHFYTPSSGKSIYAGTVKKETLAMVHSAEQIVCASSDNGALLSHPLSFYPAGSESVVVSDISRVKDDFSRSTQSQNAQVAQVELANNRRQSPTPSSPGLTDYSSSRSSSTTPQLEENKNPPTKNTESMKGRLRGYSSGYGTGKPQPHRNRVIGSTKKLHSHAKT